MDPLRFRRHFVEKVWGGRSLERTLGIDLPPDAPIGETWEVVDRERENSVVAEGEHEGRTLAALMAEYADDLLGKVPPAANGRFPLLVKYLDAQSDLSVQVHPDDDSAARVGNGAQGKTEAWTILDVAAGGALYAGLDPAVERARFGEVAAGPGVVETLCRWEVRAGQCMLVPGGTVHAIGAGVTLLEVQQNSDTTYRLYDWGRVGLDGEPRETHVPEALEVTAFGAPPRPPIDPLYEPVRDGLRRAALARSRYFGINSLELESEQRLPTAGQFQIYSVVAGGGLLRARKSGREVRLSRGDTWLVPAACGYHDVVPDPTEPLRIVQMLARP